MPAPSEWIRFFKYPLKVKVISINFVFSHYKFFHSNKISRICPKMSSSSLSIPNIQYCKISAENCVLLLEVRYLASTEEEEKIATFPLEYYGWYQHAFYNFNLCGLYLHFPFSQNVWWLIQTLDQSACKNNWNRINWKMHIY